MARVRRSESGDGRHRIRHMLLRRLLDTEIPMSAGHVGLAACVAALDGLLGGFHLDRHLQTPSVAVSETPWPVISAQVAIWHSTRCRGCVFLLAPLPEAGKPVSRLCSAPRAAPRSSGRTRAQGLACGRLSDSCRHGDNGRHVATVRLLHLRRVSHGLVGLGSSSAPGTTLNVTSKGTGTTQSGDTLSGDHQTRACAGCSTTPHRRISTAAVRCMLQPWTERLLQMWLLLSTGGPEPAPRYGEERRGRVGEPGPLGDLRHLRLTQSLWMLLQGGAKEIPVLNMSDENLHRE